MAINMWASVAPYFSVAPPAGILGEDLQRIQAYTFYESAYWNVPETFKIIPRSEDASPIYLPSARKMVEATNRFLAVDWDFVVNPQVGSPDDQNEIKGLLQAIWRREAMYAKFASQKRNGLIRGDAMWHITADPTKDESERISIHELDPSEYFPIYDPNNADRIIGCHIVDTVVDPDDETKFVSRRQTYRKEDNGTISSTLALYELAKWDDRVKADDAKLKVVLLPTEALPSEITQIPVYHIRNARSGTMWGSSDLRGIETVLAAVNQAVSDQDLAISLQGLGVYWTDSGPPKGPDGEDAPFVMGPGEVVEVSSGGSFGRVSGVTAGLPGIEHMDFMMREVSQAIGVPEIAQGKVDVSIAESGISLQMQLAPLLARNAEKEQEMLSTYDHMLYDIVHMWLPAYEGTSPDVQVDVATVVGDAMPQNREAQIAEIITLVTSVPPLITIEMAQAKLAQLGYDFPDGAGEQVLVDAQALASARGAGDPYANRYQQEIEGETA